MLGRWSRLVLNVAPLALTGFPDLPQRTVNAVDRIVIGNWQTCDGVIGFWAFARQTAKQIPLASIRVSSHNAEVRTRADTVMRDTRWNAIDCAVPDLHHLALLAAESHSYVAPV